MSATAWSIVSGIVERNKIDREPRHDLLSWADCLESRPSPTQMWRTIPRPAAVWSHWCRLLTAAGAFRSKSAGFCRCSSWVYLTASNRRSPRCTPRTSELRPMIRRLVHWDAPGYHQRTSVLPASFCWWLRTARQCTAGKGEGREPNPAERWNPVDRWMTTDPYIAPAGCGPQGTSWSIQACHHRHRIWSAADSEGMIDATDNFW